MGKKGFTLIEVLVVLGILSLLITILLPQIMGNAYALDSPRLT